MMMKEILIGADLIHRSKCSKKFCGTDIKKTAEVTSLLNDWDKICTGATKEALEKDLRITDALELVFEATEELGDNFAETFGHEVARYTFTLMYKNWAKTQRELVEPLLMKEDALGGVKEAIENALGGAFKVGNIEVMRMDGGEEQPS